MCVYVCVHVHMCTHVWNFFTRYRQSLILCESFWLFMIPCAVAFQAPLSMEFSKQEYCSGLPFPSPEDHPNPGIELRSPELQVDSLPSEPPGKIYLSPYIYINISFISVFWFQGFQALILHFQGQLSLNTRHSALPFFLSIKQFISQALLYPSYFICYSS